ncbi:hypothetical protein AAFF_G00381520 [Aldrovandia affinis]|uniref:EMI domain-containing protein n=1 Tax=Aldrovandia affinis TaxID=143900 RepID=A0AAD7X0U3_9TELE|nr:hypothetical protein AAFF_G00381520 [Aldrovandia affinis]
MARVLLLLLGFLLEVRGDIRARDPEMEEDRDPGHHFLPQRFGTHDNRSPIPGYGPVPVGPVHLFVDIPEETAPPSGEDQNYPARTGNWCRFVHHRTVTTAVHCGSESYVAKSLSPCPSGLPDCQLVLYKLSVRPVYEQKQKVVTSLLWSCCPGYGGHNCEETVADGHTSNPHEQTPGDPQEGLSDTDRQGADRQTHLSRDTSLEQRDIQPPRDPLGHTLPPAASPLDRKLTGGVGVGVASVPLPAPPASRTPPHHATSAMMAQLHPVLDGFNRTLSRLSQEVGRLSRGLAELQRDQEGGAPRGGGGGGGGSRALEAQLLESAGQLGQVRAVLSARHEELEGRLQSQNAALHHHLTTFKADADTKIRRNKVSVQSLNASLAEVRQKQHQLEEAVNKHGADQASGQTWPGTAVWEAMGRLASKVESNVAKVAVLEESSDRAARQLRDLHRGLQGLEGRVALTGRRTQSHFTDTSLDVEAARVAVLDRVGKLAENLTAHRDHLIEIDSDMDYLQEKLNSNGTPSDCDCLALATAVTELGRDVANAAEMADENRRALEGSAAGQGRWDGGWDGSLGNQRQGLQQVQESLALEQDKSRTAQLNVSRLQAAQLQSQQDVLALQQRDAEKTKEMRRLSGSFSTLLKDAIRHSEVLEVLLGEEVLEFKELPSREQQEYSIPLLRERILLSQEQIKSHGITLAALESPVANDDPLATHSVRHEREGPKMEYGAEDYSVSDFWSLGREVEELEARLRKIEGQQCPSRCCNCTSDATSSAPAGPEGELRGEVATLRRGLEDHLQVFRSIFRNAEGLARPDATLDLDALWAVVRGKEGKKQKLKKGRKEEESRSHYRGGTVNPRSRMDTAGGY